MRENSEPGERRGRAPVDRQLAHLPGRGGDRPQRRHAPADPGAPQRLSPRVSPRRGLRGRGGHVPSRHVEESPAGPDIEQQRFPLLDVEIKGHPEAEEAGRGHQASSADRPRPEADATAVGPVRESPGAEAAAGGLEAAREPVDELRGVRHDD